MSARDLLIRIKADASGLQAAMAQAQARVKSFGEEIDKSVEKRQALETLGNGFLRAGAVAVAGSALVIKAAMDWEQAWTGVRKTVEGTPAEMAALEQSLRKLATTTGFAHEEVAAVAEAAGQLGISTGGVASFTETMLAMGVSTSLSAQEAATGIARFRNIMGSTEGEIQNIGSAMVGLGNNFATTEGEILDMSLRLAGAGRQAGLTEADVLGIAAAMSSVGIEAEAGGTAMSLTMKRIGAEVDSQGPKLETFAQLAGMSAGEFSKAWKDDAAGALTSFIAGLDKAGQSGESVNGILTDLGITGIREADALLRLSANAEGVAEAVDLSSDAWRENSALMAEADKFYNTTQNSIKQAWASIKDAAISAGSAILPVIAKMADFVGTLASAFGALPEPVLTTLTAIAGIGGVGLLAAGGMIKLATAAMDTQAAFTELGVKGGRFGAAMRAATIATAAATAALIALNAVDALDSRGAKEIDALGDSLKKLGETGKATGDLKDLFGEDLRGRVRGLNYDMDSLGKAIQNFDKYGDDSSLTESLKFLGSAGTSAAITRQVEGIRDMDAALSDLSRNDPEAAIKAFERLRDVAVDGGAGADEISRAFPQMTELMRAASEATGGTADVTELLTGDMQELAPAAQMAAEAMAAAKQATADASLSFFDMSAGIDDASVSLSEWINMLAEMAEAQANWSDNVVTAMQRGVSEGVIAEFEKLGPAGARMLDELVNGSQENIDRLNGIFGEVSTSAETLARLKNEIGVPVIAQFKTAGAEDAIATAIRVAEAEDLAEGDVVAILQALDYTPEVIAQVLAGLATVEATNPTPSILLDDQTGPGFTSIFFNLGQVDAAAPTASAFLNDQASGPISGIFGELNRLDGKVVRTTVFTDYLRGQVQGGPQPGGGVLQARGSVLDFYANGGMSESHVAQIAPAGAWRVWAEPETGGEAYIPLAASKRQRSLDIWAETGKRLGVSEFAGGGMTRVGSTPASAEVTARMDTRALAAVLAPTFAEALAQQIGPGKRLRLEIES